MKSSTKIGQIAITVSDVDKALDFYRDVVGLEFLFRPGPEMVFLKSGDTRIMLTTPKGHGKVGHNSIMYFIKNDIENAFDVMVERGAEIERRPELTAKMADHDLWIGFIRDPDGNLVGIMEEK